MKHEYFHTQQVNIRPEMFGAAGDAYTHPAAHAPFPKTQPYFAATNSVSTPPLIVGFALLAHVDDPTTCCASLLAQPSATASRFRAQHGYVRLKNRPDIAVLEPAHEFRAHSSAHDFKRPYPATGQRAMMTLLKS